MNEREKARSSGSKHIYDGGFDYTLPRPPALGEERVCSITEQRGAQPHQMDRPRHHYVQKSSSPVPKSGYEIDDGIIHRPNPKPSSSIDDKPQTSTPACYKWAESLNYLLRDAEGAQLFNSYLESEKQAHVLSFWFACEGLKKLDQAEKIQKLIKVICKTYFRKFVLPIDDELRDQIIKKLRFPQCLEPPITLFDEAQAQVESFIDKTTYPNFLKSDVYLQYLQRIENPSSSSDSESSASSNKDLSNLASGVGPLPTLHEGLELNMNTQIPTIPTPGTGNLSTGYHTPTPRLTKDMLLRSQKHRALDIRPKSEAFAGLIYRSNGHVAYNSYNPVSRQDSEMQSLSSHSDARTESDSMSLHESINDGRSSRSQEKQMRQLAARNKETNMNTSLIPRTHRYNWEKNKPPTNAQEIAVHAALLIEKLEKVKRQQETQELLQKKLKETDSLSSLEEKPSTAAHLQTRDLEAAMRDKLQFPDDSDQDILDEHVSRVFADHSLSISPGMTSPKSASSPPPRWMSRPPRRRERDLFSTFSGDSGNVHDFADDLERKSSMTKSKSIPEYAGEEQRFVRGGACRRSAKELADLPDSGISVVSEVAPVAKDSRVMSWLRESERSGKVSGGGHAYSEMAVREGVRKHKRYGSRSNSLERTSTVVPAQPFIADPSMPPLPLPNTDLQLEEIRRRLTEDDGRTRSKQRSSNKYYPEVAQSGQSTLRKSMRGQRPNLPQNEEMTTVVFSFDDEQLPYRSKIPGTQITLRQFKDYLPKKGNYRFFFKTVCEDLCNQVTHEEVSNDNEILPLWEGKIIAQMKPID